MNTLESLRWRYATKKFDAERSITDAQLTQLLEAGNLTASSYGLQPYKLLVIQNQDLQNQLVGHSYNQQQVADASHVIVIAVRTDVNADYIRAFANRIEKERGLEAGEMDVYRDTMLGTIGKLPAEELYQWGRRQAYILMGTLLAAAAEMQIDTCPMEGFVADEYDEVLDLKSQNLRSVLVLPVGYRSADDVTQHQKKIRQSLDEIVVRI